MAGINDLILSAHFLRALIDVSQKLPTFLPIISALSIDTQSFNLFKNLLISFFAFRHNSKYLCAVKEGSFLLYVLNKKIMWQ